MNNKTFITIGVIVVLIVGIFIGHYFWAKQSELVGAASPINSTQIGDNFVQTSIAPLSVTGTSTSIFNNSYDRAITNGYAYCTGVTAQPAVGAWTLSIATSSAAGYTTNANYAIGAMVIGTTTSYAYVASSTFPVNAITQNWPAGTYLSFQFNATDTAACTVGVQYIQL